MGCLQSTAVPEKKHSGQIPQSTSNSPKKNEEKTAPPPVESNSKQQPLPSIGKKRRQSLGPLSPVEIQKRIEAPKETRTTVHDGREIKFAWVSQRGYYPDAPYKENQDSFTIGPHFNGEQFTSFFGVYDGHGADGHMCARFTSERLPQYLIDNLKGVEKSDIEGTERALMESHISVDKKLHNIRNIDDSMSGTTSISVLMRGKTLFISNVGDSRAIIVSKKGGEEDADKDKFVAAPLSSDQTPYRRDERDRVKKRGARIMTMDQLDGIEPMRDDWDELVLGEKIDESGDPPRIWAKNGRYPGTAFTRSIGDRMAKSLGVIAEPEILVREIQPNDRYIVIASDGVFEFITNQKTADMVVDVKDPLQGCLAVADEAYEMWFLHEDRTDDITILVIQLCDENTETAPRPYTARRRVSRPDFEQKRPRRSMIGNADEQQQQDGDAGEKRGASLLSPEEVQAVLEGYSTRDIDLGIVDDDVDGDVDGDKKAN